MVTITRLTKLFILLLVFTTGVYADRFYILYNVADDIELNLKDEYRTFKNDEVTFKKIFTYNYLINL